MASPSALREFRALITDWHSNHLNAAAATWAAATKYAITAYDDSGLTQDGLPDETLQTQIDALGAPDPGLSKGSIKVSLYAGGALANIDANPEALLVNAHLGGLANPATARNAAVGAGCTTGVLAVTNANSYVVPGQAVLCGRKGDGKGNGEVKPIYSTNSSHLVLGVLTNAAMAENDPLVFSTTCYLDESATQKYIDTLGIGKATADQKQTLGGMGKFGFSGTGTSERPKLDMELGVADHRTVPANERATLGYTAGAGQGAPWSKGIGMIQFGDYGSTTRAVRKGGELSHDTGVTFTEVPCPSGINGIEGMEKVPGVSTTEFTMLYDEDMPGVDDDFEAKTAKSLIVQFGHVMGKAFAIEQRKAFLDGKPVPKAINNLSGVSIKVHATRSSSTACNGAGTLYHWF